MLNNKYDSEFGNETRFAKKNLIWVIGLMFLISGVIWFFTRADRTIDTAINRYEEFQEMYNTCSKINTDLGTIEAVPDTDKMFLEFSKQAVIATKKQQMSRWVEEYNAKSKMWNRALWKSNTLPYQLKTEDFSNYITK